MSKFIKAASKPIRLPLNWVLPRHAVNGVKEFKFSSSRYPVCPNCSLSRFELKPETDRNFQFTWQCPSCSFTASTAEPSLKAIQLWCHDNAQDVFDNSEHQQRRQVDFNNGNEDSFVAINVKRNMLAAYAFLGLASITTFFFFYAAFNGYLFFLFNSLLFTLGILFIGLSFNYRAWLAKSNYLYGGDGKSKFHWWLKTHPWYRHPIDIGEPPSYGTSYVDDDIDEDNNGVTLRKRED